MTEYRKIIKFGSNSLIVSLPKSWTVRNQLSPGDTVRMDIQDHDLIIEPGHQEGKERQEREYTFAIDDDSPRVIKRKIFNAYLNDCDLLTLTGKEMPTKNKEIRVMIHQLMALEIIEESATRIQAKCYLNMDDINISNLIRKLDSIIRSMTLDIISQVREPKKFGDINITKNLAERDTDVNRLSFLVMRAIRHALEHPRIRKRYEQEGDLLGNWDIAQIMEKLGDILKRLSRLITDLEEGQAEGLADIISLIANHYEAIMKAHYRRDLNALHLLADKRKDIVTTIDHYQQRHERTIIVAKAVDGVKNLFYRIDEITTIMD
ncbi:phosphate uptake regulator PhoU [Candidatus Woesearchaeota archaeon]|nr:phosphate uptake regulator PhoU [Candidatus Woesearchaeota archaeon]